MDACHHAGMGDVNQALGVRADLSYGKHAAGIAMETVFFDGNVNIEDVAIFEGFVIGDAVANHMVNRCAAGFGKRGIAIVEWGRIAALYVDMVIVYQLVEFVGGNTSFYEFADVVERFSSKATEFAHFVDFFWGVDDNCHRVLWNE